MRTLRETYVDTWEVVKEKFCLVNWEHGNLGGGLKRRGEAERGAEKNVELNKNQ